MLQENPKLAVWKFTSCDGCQLTMLDLEDHLLTITNKLNIAYFREASSHEISGPYDISLVEGSITTKIDLERIISIRNQSKYLITIGACATAGGIQALKNFSNASEFLSYVYATADYIDTLKDSTPISYHVRVDFELQGCPINKHQLLELITSFLLKKKPNIKNQSVCVECKQQGNVCVMVTQNMPCLGPVTHAGCMAICPSFNRGCYGCYGPKENANTEYLSNWFANIINLSDQEIVRQYKKFYAITMPFKSQILTRENHGYKKY